MKKKKKDEWMSFVMPRDGMRIEEPSRGPWCENKKKRTNGGERESRTSVVPRGGTRDVAPGRGPWS